MKIPAPFLAKGENNFWAKEVPMTDLWTSLTAVAAPAIWIIVAFMALIKLERYRKRKLVRCPESGAVGLVDIKEETPGPDEIAARPLLRVKNCSLWPERIDCASGCLNACSMTYGSWRFDLASLAHFENHGQGKNGRVNPVTPV